jgi:arginine-tRNA-protein transferase
VKKIPFFDDEVIEFTTLETKCVYLDDKRMQMSYKYINDCSSSLASTLTKQGWRRFGKYFSRPSCKECSECISLRVDVKNFYLSRSARRVIRKNAHTHSVLTTPSQDQKKLELYEKYHKYMQKKKGWDYYPINEESYDDLYIKGASSFAKEVDYFIDDKLVGVDLIDIIDDGISAIYFYYDPDFQSYSLGRFSLFKQIELAKSLELDWIYLGYSVERCGSLNYKLSYKPHQRLLNSPSLNEEPIWF